MLKIKVLAKKVFVLATRKNHLFAGFLFMSVFLSAQVSTTCVPSMQDGCLFGDEIDSFVLNGVSTTGNSGCSGGSSGYTVFASPVRTLVAGQTYTWSATFGSTVKFAIWIDLNNDGQYTANENLVSTTTSASSATGNITIPNNATPGTNIAMRTRCKLGSANWGTSNSEACQGYYYGETEDYAVVILPCTVSPTVTISSSGSSVCPGNSVSLSASGAGTYTWTGGLNNGVAFTPTASANYTVFGSYASGCMSTATVGVVVYPKVSINSSTTQVCGSGSVSLTASGASTYTWSTNQVTPNIIVSPSSGTTYSVTGYSSQGCTTSTMVTISVNALPTITTAANPPVSCESRPVTLTAGGGLSYSWTPGNLPSGASASNIVVYPSQTTVYTVVVSDGTCSSTGQLSLTVNPNPTITISTSAIGTGSICAGQSMNYTVTGAQNYTFTTNPSSSAPFTGTSGIVTPTVNTNYVVNGANANGCVSGVQQLVFVNAVPSISITASPTLVCVGFPSTLTAYAASGSAAHAYSWAQGGTSNKAVVNPTATSIYTVTGTNTVTTCQNTQTINVQVFYATFTVTADTGVCMGSSVTLKAGGASSFSWTGGPNSANNVAFYNVSPTVATVYTVTANSTTLSLQCYSEKTVSVIIYQQPTVTATPNYTQPVCQGHTVILTGSGANTYSWSTINQSGSTVVVAPFISTTYKVIGTNLFGCKDTFDLFIGVNTDCDLGVSETSNKSFRIFPNPADGSFMLDASSSMILELHNMEGQLVKQVQVLTGGRVTVITEDLAPGVYLLTGWSEGILLRNKVVIRR